MRLIIPESEMKNPDIQGTLRKQSSLSKFILITIHLDHKIVYLNTNKKNTYKKPIYQDSKILSIIF